jgi:hypothetical protein
MSKPFIMVDLDRPRRLRFDANALVAVEEVLGRPLQEIIPPDEGRASRQVGFREMRALLWAGLLHEDPQLTLQQAGELLDLKQMNDIMAKVNEAITAAFPEAVKDEDAAKNGTAPPAPGAGGAT